MKRYIKSAIDNYTSFIDPEADPAIDELTHLDKVSEDDWNLVKSALEVFWSDYEKFPDRCSMESCDIKYSEDKRRFYEKYVDFANKCRDLSKDLKRVSGYGRMDAIKLELAKRLGAVDYFFPYGWRYE